MLYNAVWAHLEVAVVRQRCLEALLAGVRILAEHLERARRSASARATVHGDSLCLRAAFGSEGE